MSAPHSLLLAIGAKKKPDVPQAPRSLRDRMMADPMSSNYGPSDPASSPNTDPAAGGAKASREEAGFIPAGQICGGCSMFTKETGDCSAVEGVMQPHDSCSKYYDAANGASGGGDALIAALGPTSSSSQPGTQRGI